MAGTKRQCRLVNANAALRAATAELSLRLQICFPTDFSVRCRFRQRRTESVRASSDEGQENIGRLHGHDPPRPGGEKGRDMRVARVGAVILLLSGVTTGAADFLTEGVDNARTGWVRDEKIFTKAN